MNEGFTQTLTPGLRTNFKVSPNISLRYRYSVIRNTQGNRETQFIVQSPSVEFDAYIWDKVTFVSDFNYTQQDLSNERQSFQNWNARLAYRSDKDARWEFELKASNILNIDTQVRNSANNLSVFSAQTFIQPRFITLRAVYNL